LSSYRSTTRTQTPLAMRNPLTWYALCNLHRPSPPPHFVLVPFIRLAVGALLRKTCLDSTSPRITTATAGKYEFHQDRLHLRGVPKARSTVHPLRNRKYSVCFSIFRRSAH